MTWDLRKIGEIAEFFDYARRPLSSAQRANFKGNYPYYGASGIIDGVADFIFDGHYVLVSEDGENLRSRKTPIAFHAKGKFWVNNHAHIIKARVDLGLDEWIVWCIENANISGFITGAAQPKLTQEALKRVEIPFPPLPIQRKIAAVLSAYDDLIENNTRRVQVLEDMARALYREWFVEYRYPGHEDAEFVEDENGRRPAGWKYKPVSALASYVNGFAFKPEHWGQEGWPIIKIKELKAGVTATTPRCSPSVIKPVLHIQPGEILFSWSADLDAYIWPHEPGLLNQHVFRVIPNTDVHQAFLFHALKATMPRFRSLSLGATMQHIKRSALDQVFTVVPSEDLRTRFGAIAQPIHEQIINLTRRTATLRRTRDLLLPKLVSGELDVSALDIQGVEEQMQEETA